MTLVNIDSTDIVDCKLKLILGLIWTLILHYAISMPMWEGPPLGGGDPVAQKTPKEKLRDWIQNKVPDLPVGNLTKDFQGPYSIGNFVWLLFRLKYQTEIQHQLLTKFRICVQYKQNIKLKHG